MESHKIKFINTETQGEVKEFSNEKTRIDDISQHFGHGSVYLLNILGRKGENNFKNRTLILGTSFLIMSGTVVSLKNITNIQRPDGSSTNSFPSGHTATAFMGAEFLYQEYKHKSPIYGVVGYFVATSTGLFRVYNNRHWMTDIATGAGIGILSTKIAYLTNPYTKKIFTKKKQKFNETSNLFIYPFYSKDKLSLGLSLTF